MSLLTVTGLKVSYGGIHAVKGVDIRVEQGQLVALIGANGAGKTTMMDIITGKTRPDSGQVFFGSTLNLLRYSEPEIAQLGIGRKFQKPTVFEQLSVFENLELALKTAKGVGASMRFALNGEQKDRLIEVLQTIHLQNDVLRQAGNLSHGQKQWLEIGMLLMQDPKLLLLDEPVAGMTDFETERTAELFRGTEGIDEVLVGSQRERYELDHERAGEIVLVSAPSSWQAYYWWLSDDRAPQYARMVDIHRKPGYDPVELHVDMPTRSIPLNASLIKGSHGAPPHDESQRGIVISSQKGVFFGRALADIDICPLVLRQFGI